MRLYASTIVAVVSSLMACSSAKKGGDPAPAAKSVPTADALPIVPPTSAPASVLIGTWKTADCQHVAASSSAKDLLVFQGSVVIAARTFYSDDKCQTMSHTSTLQGAYKIGDAVKTGTKLDLLYNQQTSTYPSTDAVAKAVASYTTGAQAVCGSGQNPVVAGEVVDLTPCLKDPATIYAYTVFVVANSELRLAVAGSDGATSGKDDTSRATSLDGAVVYTKQ